MIGTPRVVWVKGVDKSSGIVLVSASGVVDETLQKVAKVPVPANQDELRKAVQMNPPTPNIEAITSHPLSAWVEEAFGLATKEGRLVRREPETFANAVERLASETGLDKELCSQRRSGGYR